MLDEGEDMRRRGKAEKRPADEREAIDVRERRPELVLQAALKLRLLRVAGEGRQIDRSQPDEPRLVNALHRRALVLGERRAEDFVPPDDLGEGLLEDGHVERPIEADGRLRLIR